MIRKLTYQLFLVIFIIGLSSSCVKNETCLSANNLLFADFYTIVIDPVESDTSIVKVDVDTLYMEIVGREDSILYNNLNVSGISIPLADTLDFLKIVIEINHVVDTLYLDYKPYSVFRSTECGVINRYEITDLRFTNNKIKSIYLENNTIDESEAVNLYMVVDLAD